MALVLIVDDSPTDVHVMQQALEQHGFTTAAAADGGEGLRLARELHPDLILESDRVWGLRQGAVDYLVKPVATDQLVRKAQAAIAT